MKRLFTLWFCHNNTEPNGGCYEQFQSEYWNWFKKEDEQEKILSVRQAGETDRHLSLGLQPDVMQREIDRIFDRAFHGFGVHTTLWGAASLSKSEGFFKHGSDVGGSQKKYAICVELPGIDEKALSVELYGDALVIKGAKKQEKKTEGKVFFRVEKESRLFSTGAECFRRH